jgi:4'-phosphopantetheinyl transferase EntD
MPLVHLESINAHCCWALWEINEPAGELMHVLQPTTDDLTYLNLIRHEQKRMEWLASRLAVKCLLQQWNFHYLGIRKNEWNQPLLNAYPFHISLSHTGRYGAAILHRHEKVGIDIEHCQDKLIRIRHKFLSTEEMKEAGEQLDKLTVYWCAKEALYKIYARKQLNLREHIRISPFDFQSEGTLSGRIIRDQQLPSYGITYLHHDLLTVAYAY